MTGNLLKGFRAAAFLSIISIVLVGACDRPRSTSSGATASPHEVSEVSPTVVGKQITIRGKFSLLGKPGPYVLLLGSEQAVYLVPKASYTWGQAYTEMEGKLVIASGTLRFYHAPAGPVDETRQREPDHYYFEAETTQLRLISR